MISSIVGQINTQSILSSFNWRFTWIYGDSTFKVVSEPKLPV